MNQKTTGAAVSIPRGLIISGATSLLLTLFFSAAMTFLLEKEVVSEKNIGYGVMIGLVISSFIASKIAWIKIKHRRFMVCMLAACVYLGILLSITAMFFGGRYDAVWETALLIFCGSMTAAMHGAKDNTKKNYRNAPNGYR